MSRTYGEDDHDVLNWRVLYCFDNDSMSWEELPQRGVVWVEVERGGARHRLRGMDHYWVYDTQFGMMSHHDYGGEGAAAWLWDGSRFVKQQNSAPPKGARLIDGVMLPERLYRELL